MNICTKSKMKHRCVWNDISEASYSVSWNCRGPQSHRRGPAHGISPTAEKSCSGNLKKKKKVFKKELEAFSPPLLWMVQCRSSGSHRWCRPLSPRLLWKFLERMTRSSEQSNDKSATFSQNPWTARSSWPQDETSVIVQKQVRCEWHK